MPALRKTASSPMFMGTPSNHVSMGFRNSRMVSVTGPATGWPSAVTKASSGTVMSVPDDSRTTPPSRERVTESTGTTPGPKGGWNTFSEGAAATGSASPSWNSRQPMGSSSKSRNAAGRLCGVKNDMGCGCILMTPTHSRLLSVKCSFCSLWEFTIRRPIPLDWAPICWRRVCCR